MQHYLTADQLQYALVQTTQMDDAQLEALTTALNEGFVEVYVNSDDPEGTIWYQSTEPREPYKLCMCLKDRPLIDLFPIARWRYPKPNKHNVLDVIGYRVLIRLERTVDIPPEERLEGSTLSFLFERPDESDWPTAILEPVHA